MNATQENKLSMYYKVKLFLENTDYGAPEDLESLAVLKGDFLALLTELENFEMEATDVISGYAIQKQNLRESMTKHAVMVSGGATAMFMDTGNPANAKRAKLTKSDLDSMRDTEVLNRCTQLKNLCTPYPPSLLNYGVEAGSVTQLSSAISAYKLILESPAVERSQNKAYGELVERKMAEIDAKLAIMDEVWISQMENYPELFLAYKSNRLIDDNASGGTTPPDVVSTIAPGTFQNVMTLPYLASRSFKAKNLGSEAIFWGLSTLPAEFTNPQQSLNPGSVSTLLSSTLGPDGDILLFQNTSTNPIDVEITVLE